MAQALCHLESVFTFFCPFKYNELACDGKPERSRELEDIPKNISQLELCESLFTLGSKAIKFRDCQRIASGAAIRSALLCNPE